MSEAVVWGENRKLRRRRRVSRHQHRRERKEEGRGRQKKWEVEESEVKWESWRKCHGVVPGPCGVVHFVVDHGFMDSWMTLDDIGYGPHSGPDPTGSGLVLLTS
jgi:hypothetical protein